MSSELFDRLLELSGKHRLFPKASFVFHSDDFVHSIFAVVNGEIELTRYQEDGKSVILQKAGTGSVLAEASLYSDRYHCGAIVKAEAALYEIPKNVFFAELEKSKSFSSLWGQHLSRQLQQARGMMEILSQKTVSDRFDSWLLLNGSDVPQKGEWKSIASQIGVSPEALYRELAKRRKE